MQLKHWKRKLTQARKLISLGVRAKTAWRDVYGGVGSHAVPPAVSHFLPDTRAS
jgi:hypothetical protein